MDRFAYVSKICVYAKFAYVSKSVHVTSALVTKFHIRKNSHLFDHVNLFPVHGHQTKTLSFTLYPKADIHRV